MAHTADFPNNISLILSAKRKEVSIPMLTKHCGRMA